MDGILCGWRLATGGCFGDGQSGMASRRSIGARENDTRGPRVALIVRA